MWGSSLGVSRIAEKYGKTPWEIELISADKIIVELTKLAHEDECAKNYQDIITPDKK